MSWSTTFWLYVAVSAAFWLSVVLFVGSGMSTEGRSLGIDWQLGVLLNFGLLVPLAMRHVWAWHVLAFLSMSTAVGIGVWLIESPLVLLAIPAALQFLLLWRLRSPRERVPEPRSTY